MKAKSKIFIKICLYLITLTYVLSSAEAYFIQNNTALASAWMSGIVSTLLAIEIFNGLS